MEATNANREPAPKPAAQEAKGETKRCGNCYGTGSLDDVFESTCGACAGTGEEPSTPPPPQKKIEDGRDQFGREVRCQKCRVLIDSDQTLCSRCRSTPPPPQALGEAIKKLTAAYPELVGNSTCQCKPCLAISAVLSLLDRAAAEHAELERNLTLINQHKNAYRDERDALRAEVERLKKEIEAAITALGPYAVRVHEGGGPEDIAASLAVSLAKVKEAAKRAEQAEKEREEQRGLKERFRKERDEHSAAMVAEYGARLKAEARVRELEGDNGTPWKCNVSGHAHASRLEAQECMTATANDRVRELEAQLAARPGDFGAECSGCEKGLDPDETLYCFDCWAPDVNALGKLLEAIDGNLGSMFANGDDVGSGRLVELALAKLAARPSVDVVSRLEAAVQRLERPFFKNITLRNNASDARRLEVWGEVDGREVLLITAYAAGGIIDHTITANGIAEIIRGEERVAGGEQDRKEGGNG